MKECCKTNLKVIKTANRGIMTKQCTVCGAKHYSMKADAGKYAAKT